jgi:hypothetical protein
VPRPENEESHNVGSNDRQLASTKTGTEKIILHLSATQLARKFSGLGIVVLTGLYKAKMPVDIF